MKRIAIIIIFFLLYFQTFQIQSDEKDTNIFSIISNTYSNPQLDYSLDTGNVALFVWEKTCKLTMELEEKRKKFLRCHYNSNSHKGWYGFGYCAKPEIPGKDMSEFSNGYLCFSIRSTNALAVSIGIKSGILKSEEAWVYEILLNGYNITGEWCDIKVPIKYFLEINPNIDLSSISQYFMVSCEIKFANDNEIVDFQEIYWTKENLDINWRRYNSASNIYNNQYSWIPKKSRNIVVEKLDIDPIRFSEINELCFEVDDSIWISDFEGKYKKKLFKGSNPIWSPDGKKLLFNDSNNNIVIYDTLTGLKNKFKQTGSKLSWSENGLYVVFVKNDQLICMNNNGTNVKKLAKQVYKNNYPHCYNNSVLFIRQLNDDEIPEICSIDLDGKNFKVINKGNYVSISPDKKKIAIILGYIQNNKKYLGLFIKGLKDEDKLEQLYFEPSNNEVLIYNPKWSPDAKQIAFIQMKKNDNIFNSKFCEDVFVCNVFDKNVEEIFNALEISVTIDNREYNNLPLNIHNIVWSKKYNNLYVSTYLNGLITLPFDEDNDGEIDYGLLETNMEIDMIYMVNTQKQDTPLFITYGQFPDTKIIESLYSITNHATFGNIKAQIELFKMYYAEGETKKDLFKSFWWLKKAADQGSCYAQKKLAIFYEQGIFVEKDYIEAIYWYFKANEKCYDSYSAQRLNYLIKNKNIDIDLDTLYQQYNEIGTKYFKDRKYLSAIDYIIKAIEHGYVGNNILLTSSLYYMKQYEMALNNIPICLNIIEKYNSPQIAKAGIYYIQGLIYEELENFPKALESYETALQLNPAELEYKLKSLMLKMQMND